MTEHNLVISRRIRWLTHGILALREFKAENGGIGLFEDCELGQREWKRESKYDGKGFAPVFAPRGDLSICKIEVLSLRKRERDKVYYSSI